MVYDGKLYRQNFWNVGQRPDLNSAQFGKPWLQPEACGLVPPPVAQIEGPSTANANDLVKLSAGGSSGKDLKYAWTSLDGIALQVNGAEATFKAPTLEQDKNLTFRVEITDTQGRKTNASHVIKVKGQSGGSGGGGDDVPAYRPGTDYQAGYRVTNDRLRRDAQRLDSGSVFRHVRAVFASQDRGDQPSRWRRRIPRTQCHGSGDRFGILAGGLA